MGIWKGRMKKRFTLMTWQLCQTILGCHRQKYMPLAAKSAPKRETKREVAPEGCFSVYVGAEKQKFVIKTKHANHPLFRMLLEDAELEYGYNSEGPILIPCKVDQFCELLTEMHRKGIASFGAVGCGSCAIFSPCFHLGGRRNMAKCCGSYSFLTSS